MGVGPVGFSVEQQNLLWVMWRRGDSIREMERRLGETLPRIGRFLRQSGGIPPVPRRRRAEHLSLLEREEISRGIAAGLSARSIAGRIGRPSSTVSREIGVVGDARHTCGTLMNMQGVPIVVISAWLGHADPSFTMRTYVHNQDDALKVAGASLQQVVSTSCH